ncbi:MAG: S41 family peptidase [Flavisolibacter sp.]
MKAVFCFLVVVLPFVCPAQKSDSVRVFVDSALNIMQNKSMFAKILEWSKIRDTVHVMAKDATTYEEAAPAIKFAFNLLNDKHGWLVLNDENYINPFLARDNSRINEATKAVIVKPAIRTSVLQKQYAYVSVPFFGGQTTKGMNEFAQRLQDSLCKVVSPATKGIIIDLRLNGGGNMYPMVVGLSNLLPAGMLTESVNSSGEKDGEFILKGYSVTLLDTMVVALKRTCGALQQTPVAVIIGPATGSAGEQLAIILSTRKHTTLIGENTAGYVTGNNGFLLPGKNNGIVIGESYTRDRNGKVYMEDVAPNIKVTGGDDFLNLLNDKKIMAAMKWFLEKQ